MVSGLCENQTLQNLALARLWALGSARLWAELRRLWARGSGAPNPFFLVARNCPSNASNPSNPSNAPTLANGCAIRLDSGRFRRSMDASDAPKPRTCSVVSGLCENQTLQNLALARLWALRSASLWAELRRLWVRGSGAPHTFGVAQAVGSGRWRAGAASLWILDASDAPKPRTCQTVGGIAQAVGSGLWRAKSFFSSGPKLPFKPLKPLKRSDTCQWLCHTSGFWTLQTLHGCFRRSKTSHLLDCGLWALRESDASKPRTCQTVGSGLCETVGGVAQAVGSGLWRAKSFFSSGPKLPFKRLKPLKPLKRSDTCQWLCHTSGFWTLQTLHGCFRRSKTSHLLCGLWALRESDAPKPRTCQTALSHPN